MTRVSSHTKGMFYLRDTRREPEGRALWWGPNRGGYTTILEMAGLYDEAEATRIVLGNSGDTEAVSAEAVAIAVRRVVPMENLRAALDQLKSRHPKITQRMAWSRVSRSQKGGE